MGIFKLEARVGGRSSAGARLAIARPNPQLAVGRDYAVVPPTRGIFKGNAKEKMDVEVSVTVY